MHIGCRTKAHKEEILCCAHIFLLGQDNPSGMLLTAGNDRMIKRWRINDRFVSLKAHLYLSPHLAHRLPLCRLVGVGELSNDLL